MTDRDATPTETEPEEPADLAQEVERGESERTPLLVLSGVMLAAALVVGVLVVLLLLVYFLF